MRLPDLSLIHKILNWHQGSDHKGESIGVFIVVPREIARQFPDAGKEGEDDSVPHITLIYLGKIPMFFTYRVRTAVENVCAMMKPFKVRLGKPKKLINKDGQTVRYSPVISRRLCRLHDLIKAELMRNLVPVSNDFPDYLPHVTIEYVNVGEKPKFKHIKPEGNFSVDSVWIWGTEEPAWIPFGRK